MRAAIFIVSIILFQSCTKSDFVWDLKRDAVNDAQQNADSTQNSQLPAYSTKLSTISGESLNNIQYYVEGGGCQSCTYWEIAKGYIGNGFCTNGNALRGYIEFESNFNQNTILRFWTKTGNLFNTSNRYPSITVNGQTINSALVGGNGEAGNWMKIQTATVPAGNNTIRIAFNSGGVFIDYLIDEIEVWGK